MRETKKGKQCNGIVEHEEITLLKQDYEKLVEREEYLTKQVYDLQKENEVLRRALELACDELDTWHRSCDNRPDYFIQQAKEMLNKN